MNKIYSIVVIGLCMTVLLMIWFPQFIKEKIIIEAIDDQTTIKAGQIWSSETDDPFREDIYWYIVEIKEDYVGFTNVKYNKDKDLWVIPKQIPYITSSKISIFKSIYVRVK